MMACLRSCCDKGSLSSVNRRVSSYQRRSPAPAAVHVWGIRRSPWISAASLLRAPYAPPRSTSSTNIAFTRLLHTQQSAHHSSKRTWAAHPLGPPCRLAWSTRSGAKRRAASLPAVPRRSPQLGMRRLTVRLAARAAAVRTSRRSLAGPTSNGSGALICATPTGRRRRCVGAADQSAQYGLCLALV